MKLVLDLPEEFREHFQFDKFQDSFMRICGDIKEISLSHSKPNSDSLGLSGNYERELVDVLKTAFGKAVDLEQITSLKLRNLTPEELEKFEKFKNFLLHREAILSYCLHPKTFPQQTKE